MKHDYTALDAAILDKIIYGAKTFSLIDTGEVSEQANIIALLNGRSMHDGWRVTDRRLQALRKKGAIVFHNREWRINHG